MVEAVGLFSGLLGNASQKDIEKRKDNWEDILTSTENVELAFSLIRDLIVNKRLNDWQRYISRFPYRSISRFSVAGHFD